MRARSFSTAVAVVLALTASSRATMVARLPFERVVHEAARIVHATVADVRSGRDASGLPATWVTLDVARTLKGPAAGRLTIKQYGTATALPDGTLTRPAGLPRYRTGEEVVVLLRAESRLGFTSPVGFGQGVYRVRRRGGRARVRGEAAGGGARDLDDLLADIVRRTLATP